MQPVLGTSGGLRIAEVLTSSQKSKKPVDSGRASNPRPKGEPEWTDGLKRLYDSVVDEPLPANFAELLAKLDQDS